MKSFKGYLKERFQDWKEEYEKRNDPEHPYCTNWPVNKKKGENEKI